MILKELLRGFVGDCPQSVANMTVIPLMAPDTEYENVGDIGDVYLDRDTSYSSLHLGSKANRVTIVPNGLTYITKEKAQDRAVPRAHLINSPKEVNAFCVQSSQCGYMGKGKEGRQMRLLPQSLRYAAFQRRTSANYSELWQSIGQYNRSSGCSGDFLTTYFTKYADQLDEFVAEFEVVPKQRGAIVLINDEVVGVEIAPNTKAFEAIWEPAIRDCYGSEALRAREKAKPAEEEFLGDVADLDDLTTAVARLEEKERARVQELVNSILKQRGRKTKSHQLEELTMHDVETGDYVGFGVTTDSVDEGFIFLSLISKPLAARDFAFN